MSNILDISVEEMNRLFLEPLGLLLYKEMGHWGDWVIVDQKSGATARARGQDPSKKVFEEKRNPQWLMRFHDCIDAVAQIAKMLVTRVEAMYVVRPTAATGGHLVGKLIELKNPMFQAKSIEEAQVKLDLVLACQP